VTVDIIIRNARLRDRPAPVDIGIEGGRVVGLGDDIGSANAREFDAGGMLVTESFANPHLHLCKVYTLDRMDELALTDYHGGQMGKAMNAIELAARVKADYDEEWIVPNARKAVALAALHGNTHIRAFADVDTKAGLVGVKSLLRVRDEFAGTVDLQVVAFAQDGLVREPGASVLMREAMELGADVVGGIPWIEFTESDERAHVDEIFDLAVEFDKPVSMLVDDAGDPGLRTLEMMATRTIERGWHGRSLAHHARAMALYPKPYLQKVAALLKSAGLPRARRHLGCLLPAGPKQHAGGCVPGGPSPVDDHCGRDGKGLFDGDNRCRGGDGSGGLSSGGGRGCAPRRAGSTGHPGSPAEPCSTQACDQPWKADRRARHASDRG
jgi:cytosine deaminase